MAQLNTLEPRTANLPPAQNWLKRGFRFGEWFVLPAENSIQRDDRSIRLEPKVMRLLLALVARHDTPCSRDELLNQLWPSPDVGESALTRTMCQLRKALGDRRNRARYIDTIQNIGYKAIAPIRPGLQRRPAMLEDGAVGAVSESQELCTIARYLLVRGNQRDAGLAFDLLQRHHEVRPDQAQVAALLAHAEAQMLQFTETPPAFHQRRAQEFAERALRLDGANSLAWATLGNLAHRQWRWLDAQEHYERAMAFEHDDPLVADGYVRLLLNLGRIDEARTLAQRNSLAQPTAASLRLTLCRVLMHGDDSRVLAELAKARQYGAEHRLCDTFECLLLHRQGWTYEGIQRWTELNQLHLGQARWLWPSYFLDALTRGQSGPALVLNIRERVLLGHLDAGIAPFMLTAAGELDGAFELAATAIEQRRFFSLDPWLREMRPFREDPRFMNIARACGLSAKQLTESSATPVSA